MQTQLAAKSMDWPALYTVPIPRGRRIKTARAATAIKIDRDRLPWFDLNQITDAQRAAMYQAKYRPQRAEAATREIDVGPVASKSFHSRSNDADSQDSRIALMRAITRLVLGVRHTQEPKIDPLLDSMKDAIAFIANLPADVTKPTVSASEDGEIFIQWKTVKGRALTTFEGDGSYGYAMQVGPEFVPGKVRISSPIEKPSDLVAYLKQIS